MLEQLSGAAQAAAVEARSSGGGQLGERTARRGTTPHHLLLLTHGPRMGAWGSRGFERNDQIPGQGRALVADCRTLGIKTRQLDRLYQEFCRFEDVETYTLDVEGMLSFFRIDHATQPILDVLFLGKFDKSVNRSFDLLFHDFVLTMWDFLTTSDGDLFANFMFQHIDINSTNVVDVFEVKYLIQLVWKFKPNRETSSALGKLDKNDDGLVTMAEFALLYRHFPAILRPVVKVREVMRKKLAFWRFWKEIADHRKKIFFSRSIFDILDRHDTKECRLAALNHVAERNDVPLPYADRWRDTMLKKADKEEKKESLELPEELLSEEEVREREERKMKLFLEQERLKKANSKLVKRAGPHLDFSSDEALLADSDQRVDELIKLLAGQKHRKPGTGSHKRHASISPK